MPNLEKAISIAVNAHEGQKDKAESPYILHALRVMFAMSSENEMIVAVLHDVIEDTEIDLDHLRESGFSDKILAALTALTHQENEAYEAYIQRLSKNPLARRVKLADLEDNMDARRFTKLAPEFCERHAKYHKAWHLLSANSHKI